jgi:hypothetical protein
MTAHVDPIANVVTIANALTVEQINTTHIDLTDAQIMTVPVDQIAAVVITVDAITVELVSTAHIKPLNLKIPVHVDQAAPVMEIAVVVLETL